MNARIVLVISGSTEKASEQVLSFRFEKEAYMPYTILSAMFATDQLITGEVTAVKLYLGSMLIHYGTADTFKVSYRGGCYQVILTSRSFTAMLLQNQLQPGMYNNISLNSLMDGFVTIPHVTHEDSDDASGYIFVKYGSDQWDGIVNLCYKQQETYPYISGTNCVMFTPKTDPMQVTIGTERQLETGRQSIDKRIISDWHMADVDDTYGDFDLHVTAADSRGIVRHRYFEFDRQYLYDPTKALAYRAAYAARGMQSDYCIYSGYSGEDLYDTVSFGRVTGRICHMVITGSKQGISTLLAVYHDAFHP